MTPTNDAAPHYKVRAVECHYEASEDAVYEALKRATAPLTDSWERLRKAKRIGIKFNQDKEPKNRVYFEGQLQQLVSTKVARAFLRLLRKDRRPPGGARRELLHHV
ncbi:MAG: hypothetical protein R2911_22420 [Caldilineaceae bacterium]